jgi:hypothetical protein
MRFARRTKPRTTRSGLQTVEDLAPQRDVFLIPLQPRVQSAIGDGGRRVTSKHLYCSGRHSRCLGTRLYGLHWTTVS